MARVAREGDVTVIITESQDELELLRHGERAGGELVLLEGYYPIRADRLLLPESISPQGAERVRKALEQAALSHREARRRREQFRLVKE
jgi:hypothetical protein